jgi:hypothetical protein
VLQKMLRGNCHAVIEQAQNLRFKMDTELKQEVCTCRHFVDSCKTYAHVVILRFGAG